MKRKVEFEIEGYTIKATAECNEQNGGVQDISYDIISSDTGAPSFDDEMHDTIMDYAYYLLKDGDHTDELNFD